MKYVTQIYLLYTRMQDPLKLCMEKSKKNFILHKYSACVCTAFYGREC